MDKYRIDSHKLLYHVDRLHDWLCDRLVYPIYLEISPSGTCNHRCRFCAKDFMGYEKVFLPAEPLRERLREFGDVGIRSIMFAGEGEPLLHPDLPKIVQWTREAGIDVAITTNGVLLDRRRTPSLLEHCSWIKVSINAGAPTTYSRLHHTKEADFNTVITNIEEAVNVREKNGWRCTIGMQILLLPENRDEVERLAGIAKQIGADYLVVKPYSQHLKSHTTQYRDIRYHGLLPLARRLDALNDERFDVIFRRNAMQKWDSAERPYETCLALPFWSYIDAKGNVWGCSSFLLDDDFLYGNILAETFQNIWTGERRRRLIEKMASSFQIEACRTNCRMDEVNRFLWELRHPPAHVNFI